jgi:hypothetical protein
MERYRKIQCGLTLKFIFKNLQFISNLQSVLDIYGDWLFERRDFKEAALGNARSIKTPDFADGLNYAFQFLLKQGHYQKH